MRDTEIYLRALTLLFPRADVIWEVSGTSGSHHCLYMCKAWCYTGGWGYPPRHGSAEPGLSQKEKSKPLVHPSNGIRFLEQFQLLALIKAI